MVNRSPSRGSAGPGTYVWRGGLRIPPERDVDRFSVIVSPAAQMSRVRTTPGVLRVAPLTERVVVHHAFRPRGTRGRLCHVTDRIIPRVLKGYDPSTFHVHATPSPGANPVKVAVAEMDGRYAHGRSEWFRFGNVNAARTVAGAVRIKAAGRAG